MIKYNLFSELLEIIGYELPFNNFGEYLNLINDNDIATLEYIELYLKEYKDDIFCLYKDLRYINFENKQLENSINNVIENVIYEIDINLYNNYISEEDIDKIIENAIKEINILKLNFYENYKKDYFKDENLLSLIHKIKRMEENEKLILDKKTNDFINKCIQKYYFNRQEEKNDNIL